MKIGFNPSFSKISPIDPEVKAKLDILGIIPTGTQEGDLAAIEKAKSGKKDKNCEKSHSAPPWIQLMQTLGLEPTGTKEGDFLAISAKLDEMEAQATTQSQLDNVQSLRAEFSSIASIANSNKPELPQQKDNNNLVGQNQLAVLNKWFLLKSKT